MRVLRWLSNIWMLVLILNLLLALALIGGCYLLPQTTPAPAFRAADPADRSQNIPVRVRPEIIFNGPMNPRSVEAALQFEPTTPTILIWDAQFTTLTISPTLNLRPATDYTIRINPAALNQRLRPLNEPIVVGFRTAQAPAVRAISPSNGSTNVAPLTPIVLSFSRTMVPANAVLREIELPELHFDPPVAGKALWLDQSTLLFRLDGSFLPGQQYQATLDASLEDVEGGPLDQPFAWQFRVAPPAVLSSNPRDSARDIPLGMPLTITLSQALPTAQLQQSLVITPTTSGRLVTAILPDQTQVLTFTPTLGWQPGSEYQALLQTGSNSNNTIRFQSAPRLALSGRFPGEGQILPSGQSIRLVFTTPVDPEAVRNAMQFDPPVQDIQITGTGSEFRIAANLQAATAYTLTISPDLVDRSGNALALPAVMRFITAPAPPALALPEITYQRTQFLPDEPIELLIQRTNTSALFLDLFDMDEETVVRTLVFSSTDWQRFDPTRYQRPLRRTWLQPLSDPLNRSTADRVAIADKNGANLPPGIYYLRIRTSEGPRADLIFSVTRTRLHLQLGTTSGLIWATDAISGTVLPALPIAIYQDNVLILEDSTDTDGLLRFNLNGGVPHTYAALARSLNSTLVTSEPLTLPASTKPNTYRLWLMTPATTYHPGESLPIAGFVRQVISDTLRLPDAERTLQIQLRTNSGRILTTGQAQVGPTGSYSATLTLRPDLPPGEYLLSVTLDASKQQQPIQIIAPGTDQQLSIQLVSPAAGSPPAAANLLAETTRGSPLASLPISWTLTASYASPPLPPGYQAGTSDQILPPPSVGSTNTGSNGRITLPITPTIAPANLPVRYRFSASTSSTSATASFTIDPTSRYIGLRAASQIAPAEGALPIDLIVIDQRGRPIGGQPIQIQLFGAEQLNARPIFSRRIVTSSDGLARLEIDPPKSGAYLLRATTRDPQQRLALSELSLWAAGTPTSSIAAPQLIASQPSYLPGTSATLLPEFPAPIPHALLLVEQGTTLDSIVRVIQPGQPLSVTLATDPFTATRVTIIAPPTATAPARSASALLPVAEPAPPTLVMSSDQPSYLPGATATITASVSSADGTPLPADLMIALLADGPTPSQNPTIYWSGPLRAANGVLSVAIPLPSKPGQLHAVVWAANDQTVAQASLDLAIEREVAIYLDPPAFLRPGDRLQLPSRIVSHSALTQTLTITLQSEHLNPAASTAVSQTISLAPYATAALKWDVSADANETARVKLTALSSREVAADQVVIPILRETRSVAEGSALVTASYLARIPISSEGQLQIDLAGSPDAVAIAAAKAIAAQPIRSVLDDAALLMISAPLSGTHELALAQIARLAAAQRPDGGWGWWPELRSDPTTTAVVLEALANAGEAQLRIPERTRSAGLAWAERNLNTPFAASEQAALAYALARNGRAPTGYLTNPNLRIEALSAPEAAFRALALTNSQADARNAAIQRLKSLASHSQGQSSWGASPGQTEHQVEITALALQALAQANAEPALQREALAALASWRTPSGWDSPYATARALSALRIAWPHTTPALQYSVDLNDQRLLAQSGGALTTSQLLTIPANRLSATNLLTVTVSGSPLLVSYQFVGPATQSSSGNAVQILYQQRAPQAPGQPSNIQMIVIVQEQLTYTQLEIPLPPSARIQRSPDTLPWVFVGRSADRLIFAQDSIVPGVYEFDYQLEQDIPGEFQVPQPIVRDIHGQVVSRIQELRKQ